MDKRLLIANAFGLIIIAGFLGYAIYLKEATPVNPVAEEINDAQLIDGAEVTFGEGVEDAVSQNIPGVYETKVILSQKYKKRPDEIRLNVADSDEHHIRGNVSIGVGGPENTGMVFASDIKGSWEVVWDGNGVIPCSPLLAYDFPDDMRWDCEE